jgi:hypothetical protein
MQIASTRPTLTPRRVARKLDPRDRNVAYAVVCRVPAGPQMQSSEGCAVPAQGRDLSMQVQMLVVGRNQAELRCWNRSAPAAEARAEAEGAPRNRSGARPRLTSPPLLPNASISASLGGLADGSDRGDSALVARWGRSRRRRRARLPSRRSGTKIDRRRTPPFFAEERVARQRARDVRRSHRNWFIRSVLTCWILVCSRLTGAQ